MMKTAFLEKAISHTQVGSAALRKGAYPQKALKCSGCIPSSRNEVIAKVCDLVRAEYTLIIWEVKEKL